MNMKSVFISLGLLSVGTGFAVQTGGPWEGPASKRQGLTTYSGTVPGWTGGAQDVGLVGEDTDRLITGNLKADGAFTLSFLRDTPLLEEYAIPLVLSVPYKDLCMYDECKVKISDPDALWIRLREFGPIVNGEHNQWSFLNGEDVKTPPPLNLFKTSRVRQFVYSSVPVDVEGHVMAKGSLLIPKLTLTYDLHLPAGWSFIEEESDRIFDAKGEILETRRVIRSVAPPQGAWVALEAPAEEESGEEE